MKDKNNMNFSHQVFLYPSVFKHKESYIKVSYVLIFLYCLLSFNTMQAQCSLGDPVFVENFGSGAARLGPSLNQDPNGVHPNFRPAGLYTYIGTGNIGPDEYGIIKNAKDASGAPNGASWNDDFVDHTPNSVDGGLGYMYYCDANEELNVFYAQKITGLCSQIEYELSAWFAKTNAPDYFIDPNIKLIVGFTDSNDNDLGIVDADTGPIEGVGLNRWQRRALVFTVPVGTENVYFMLRNNVAGVGGNDLAIDDIEVRPCGPLVSIIDEDTSTVVDKDTIICLGGNDSDISIKSDLASSFVMQWQELTASNVWIDIPGANGQSLNHTLPANPIEPYKVRLKFAHSAANLLNTKCHFFSDEITINKVRANAVSDLELCDNLDDGDKTNGIAQTFDLESQTATILGSQAPSDFSVTYHLSNADAVSGAAPLSSPHANTLSRDTELIHVRVVNNNTGCVNSDLTFNLIVNPLPIANVVSDLELCDNLDDGDQTNGIVQTFDLESQTATILGSQPPSDFAVTYHLSQADAVSGAGALSSPHANTLSRDTELIHVRVLNKHTGCVNSDLTFNLIVNPLPIANVVSDLELCDNLDDGSDTNGIVQTFNLESQTATILGSQPDLDFTVTYHLSQADAVSGAGALSSLHANTLSANTQLIYVRVVNDQTGCVNSDLTFNLVVNPLPVVASVVDLIQCDDDADGEVPFNLAEANQLISADYLNEVFTYYETLPEAESGLVIDQITNITTYTNASLNDNIYARIETVKGCYRTARINLIVGVSQIPPSFQILDYYECDTKEVDDDNTNGITSFDFSDAEKLIEDLFPAGSVSVTFYNNEADALAELNVIKDLENHRNEGYPNTQQIYVRVDSEAVNACLGLGHYINLTVDTVPIVNSIDDYTLCSNTDEAIFDLTTKASEIIGVENRPLLISYHESEQDAIDNIAIANPTNYPSKATTIYVRAQFDDNNNNLLDDRECVSTDMKFNLVVNSNPVLVQPDPILICNDQVNTTYDLTVRNEQITNSDSSITLSFYESQQDLIDNTPITTPENYTNTQLSRNIIVQGTGSNGCTVVTTLSLNTIIYANLNLRPGAIEECEIDNNGYDEFDIRRREIAILNGLNPAHFTFTYYQQEPDAIAGNANSITNPESFINVDKDNQTIYARVLPVTNDCFQVVPIELIVNPVPEIDIEEEYVVCLDTNSNIISPELMTFLTNPPIDTKLSSQEYTFQWYNDTECLPENIIAGETEAYYTPTKMGDYTVIATNRATGCTIPATTKVIGSFPPENISVELVSDTFSGNNILEVTVTGRGIYEYRLDGGTWQSAPRFERVRGGERTIYVRDIYNCNEASTMKVIIDYPKYFTPNGDGFNDTWNILGISGQSNAKIYVHDRYGKLLKQILPKSLGWNGIFNGSLMPTDDYWFTVEYIDPNDDIMKVFRGHFTLKR